MSKTEMIRRLRLGDVQNVLRARYGPVLPDDDAGREDLRELLLVISLGSEAGRKMDNAVAVWAPWMAANEATTLVDDINLTEARYRKPTARELGERLRLTYEERKALGIRTIAPCDVTDDELQERRKARASYLRWKRRQAKGSKTRAEYLAANQISRLQPWKAAGQSRATWYRNRAKVSGETSMSDIKLNKHVTHLSHFSKEDNRQGPELVNENKYHITRSQRVARA